MGDESKRGRVRRLLVEPLEADGMRISSKLKPKIVDGETVMTVEERHKEWIAKLCDMLAYMTDAGLEQLQESLRFNAAARPLKKGQKRSFKDEWPGTVPIFDLANAFEACPLEQWPGLCSWFASVEGPRALDLDCEVETYDFVMRHKRPPYLPRDRQGISAEAADRRRRLTILEERGLYLADDEMFKTRFEFKRAKVRKLISDLRGDDGEVGAA